MTAIEWVQGPDGSRGETWNPTLGCSKVSPGCDGCYAINVAHRGLTPAHQGLTIKRAGEKPDWTGQIRLMHDRLDIPLRRRKPTTFFVDSMSDLFHPDVPDEFIARVWQTMARSGRFMTDWLGPRPGPHTYQVLTKRPQRMADIVSRLLVNEGGGDVYLYDHAITALSLGARPLPNVWLGTSIESDRYTFRADHLRATPAAVRFLSLEPLLGPLPSLDLTGIDWVIVGGESGPGARPMHPDWARDIRDRCIVAGIPFFFKQWGAWVPLGPLYDQHEEALDEEYDEAADDARMEAAYARMEAACAEVHGSEVIELERSGAIAVGYQPPDHRTWLMLRLSKKAAGRELDGRTWDEMPGVAR